MCVVMCRAVTCAALRCVFRVVSCCVVAWRDVAPFPSAVRSFRVVSPRPRHRPLPAPPRPPYSLYLAHPLPRTALGPGCLLQQLSPLPPIPVSAPPILFPAPRCSSPYPGESDTRRGLTFALHTGDL